MIKNSGIWATPIESLIRNSGDCEDFAIAKYFTLLAMDVPEDQLKITFVKLNNQLGHMVFILLPLRFFRSAYFRQYAG